MRGQWSNDHNKKGKQRKSTPPPRIENRRRGSELYTSSVNQSHRPNTGEHCGDQQPPHRKSRPLGSKPMGWGTSPSECGGVFRSLEAHLSYGAQVFPSAPWPSPCHRHLHAEDRQHANRRRKPQRCGQQQTPQLVSRDRTKRLKMEFYYIKS